MVLSLITDTVLDITFGVVWWITKNSVNVIYNGVTYVFSSDKTSCQEDSEDSEDSEDINENYEILNEFKDLKKELEEIKTELRTIKKSNS